MITCLSSERQTDLSDTGDIPAVHYASSLLWIRLWDRISNSFTQNHLHAWPVEMVQGSKDPYVLLETSLLRSLTHKGVMSWNTPEHFTLSQHYSGWKQGSQYFHFQNSVFNRIISSFLFERIPFSKAWQKKHSQQQQNSVWFNCLHFPLHLTELKSTSNSSFHFHFNPITDAAKSDSKEIYNWFINRWLKAFMSFFSSLISKGECVTGNTKKRILVIVLG